MALEKAAGMAGMNNLKPTEALNRGAQGPAAKGLGAEAGVDFRKALDQASLRDMMQPMGVPTGNVGGPAKAGMPAVGMPSAGMPSVSGAEKLKFSNHAVERMRSRGISFQPEEMTRIENAIAKAAAKGSKDTLVLSGDNALIVSVKNSTVVTVMDKTAMKDNVFTNIDSTVVV